MSNPNKTTLEYAGKTSPMFAICEHIPGKRGIHVIAEEALDWYSDETTMLQYAEYQGELYEMNGSHLTGYIVRN